MRFIGGSPLSEKELWGCAAAMLKRYGDGARDKILSRADQMQVNGDLPGFITWMNIFLCHLSITDRGEGGPAN